jgi:hypothetical protein
MERAWMSLARMTGLIALSVVATTVQANARPVPAAKPSAPSRQEGPRPNHGVPACKTQQQDNKQELILVIAPSTSAWSDPAARCDLDGSGLEPVAHEGTVDDVVPAFEHARIGQVEDHSVAGPPVQTTRPWLAARYPHAPPRQA